MTQCLILCCSTFFTTKRRISLQTCDNERQAKERFF